MKIWIRRLRQDASALLVVMVLSAASLMILAGTMQWTSTTSNLNDRAVRHSVALAAAEAATENVIAALATDFAKQGAAEVNGKVSTYKLRVPKAAESAHWGKFKFSNGKKQN